MIYIVTIFISVFSAFMSYKIKPNNKSNLFAKHIFAFISFLLPFLVSAFRDINIGTDTRGTYYSIFIIAFKKGRGVRDFGYYLLNRFCILFTDNYQFVIFVTSLATVGFAYYHIFNKSKHPYFSVFLFFATNVYFISMNMIRQSIATMLFIFAISAIKNKNYKKYFLICLIAFSFHSSAILYIPLYFLCKKEFNIKKSLIILIVIATFGSFFANFIIKFLTMIPYFSKYFGWYIGSSYNTESISVISLIISILILIVLCICKKQGNNSEDLNIMLYMQFISSILLSISSFIPMMQRTSWLFSFPLFIYLPDFILGIKNAFLRTSLKYGILIGYFAYMFLTIIIYRYNEVYPYISIFN